MKTATQNALPLAPSTPRHGTRRFVLAVGLILATSSGAWAQSDTHDEQAFKDGTDAYGGGA